MINLDVASVTAPRSMPGYLPEVTFTVQDHPLFLGYVPGGTITDHQCIITHRQKEARKVGVLCGIVGSRERQCGLGFG
jgi:hypothetical protein